jgi:hypothetical protein
VHAFRVASKTARWLDLTTPQHGRFVRAAGEPEQERVIRPEGLIGMEKVGAAQQHYGIEILGPPPWCSRLTLALGYCSIQRSAWEGYSPKFG